jgi:biopolymer transport protein ExbD
MTSMTDMFIMILVFLLHFVDPSQDAMGDIALPRATSAKESTEAVTLTVTPEGLSVDGHRVVAATDLVPSARDALTTSLKAARAKSSEPVLRVAADKTVPYRVVSGALTAAADAGFDQYKLVVIHDAGTAP